MMCIASGGLLGLGGGNGWLKYVAASDTDLVFATVSEEWGLLIGVMMVLAVVCLGAFVVRAAPVGRSSFHHWRLCSHQHSHGPDHPQCAGYCGSAASHWRHLPLCFQRRLQHDLRLGMLAFIKAADTRQNASFAIRLPSRKKEAVQYE